MDLSSGSLVIIAAGGWIINIIVLAALSIYLSTKDIPIILDKPSRIGLGLISLLPWSLPIVMLVMGVTVFGIAIGMAIYSLFSGKPLG